MGVPLVVNINSVIVKEFYQMFFSRRIVCLVI